jgi:virulence factor Mce-like protein
MVTQAPRRSAVAIALAFTLSCVGLMIFVWTQFGGTIPFSPQGYRVKAVFNETGLLVPNADVRIAGVNVGKVTSVQAQGTHSLVTMNIQQQYAPIPRDTRAILREKTLLGEGFIALSSGDGQGPKLPDGGTIPSAQIAPTQQLDQVLNSFTTPVQHDLQAFLIGTGAALHGRGQSLSDAFGNFDPTATQLNAIIQVLNQQQGNLQSLIANGATVLTSLGDRGTALRDLISSGDSVLSATAAQDRSLTATVNAMPAFLAQLRTTLGRVNRTLQIAHPSLTALQGVAPRVKPALQALSAATPALVALLREAPGVLRVADRALPSVNRFIGELKPVGDALLPAAQQLAPVINVLAEYRQNIVNAMALLSSTMIARAPAATTQSVGGIPAGMANYIRIGLTLGPDSVWGATSRNPAVRYNPYPAPGEAGDIASGGLKAASCVGAGAGNVPCTLQPGYPWGHGIGTTYYPRITAAKP